MTLQNTVETTSYRMHIEDINKLYVKNVQGQPVPISNLVRYELTTNPSIVNHFNIFRSIQISGEAGPGYSSGDAIKALEANNEADAKKFLEQKASLTNKLTGYQEAYALAHGNATNMKSMHDKLVSDINELESRKDMIKGKLAVAKTQERINKMGSSVASANNSMASFERFEDIANKKLDEANAMAELNRSTPENNMKDLTAKYDSPSSDIDNELAALKASLGK